jgi:two-component system, OmpR family, sensor kinase
VARYSPVPRLLFRFYLSGIVMFALATGAIFVVGAFIQRPPTEVPTRPSTAWIAWHMADLSDDLPKLRRELAELKARSRIEMSVFEASGALIASNAATPPLALSTKELRGLEQEPTHFSSGSGVVASLGPGGSVERYVRLTYPEPDVPLTVTTAQLVAALGVLALFSVLLARSVTEPLGRLVQAAHAFGQGNLTARADVQRRDELGDLSRAFDEMADRLTALRRAEKELLANVSHELRTPLARIRLALELMRDGDARTAAGYFVDIEEDLVELERLLDDVMTTARLDIERRPEADPLPPLRRKRIPSAELLHAARLRFARRAPSRKLRFQTSGALPEIDADPALLRRVVDNLLDNAVKFSDPEEEITLEATQQDDTGELVIRVRDHGTGIDAVDQKRVFEPFFRADRSRDRATGGVGLGLTLASRIVAAHGGELTLESSDANGSCFLVRVPAAGAVQHLPPRSL